jgi:hypothetical protein
MRRSRCNKIMMAVGFVSPAPFPHSGSLPVARMLAALPPSICREAQKMCYGPFPGRVRPFLRSWAGHGSSGTIGSGVGVGR